MNFNTKSNDREDVFTRRYLKPLGIVVWEAPCSSVWVTSWKFELIPASWIWAWTCSVGPRLSNNCLCRRWKTGEKSENHGRYIHMESIPCYKTIKKIWTKEIYAQKQRNKNNRHKTHYGLKRFPLNLWLPLPNLNLALAENAGRKTPMKKRKHNDY